MWGAFKSWWSWNGNQIKLCGFTWPTCHWALRCFIYVLPWKVCRVKPVLEGCLALPGAVGTVGMFVCMGCSMAWSVLLPGHKKRSKISKAQTLCFSVSYCHSLQILTPRINFNQIQCYFVNFFLYFTEKYREYIFFVKRFNLSIFDSHLFNPEHGEIVCVSSWEHTNRLRQGTFIPTSITFSSLDYVSVSQEFLKDVTCVLPWEQVVELEGQRRE